MGEAKRRSKLDSCYGKFVNISNQSLFEQQLERLLREYTDSRRVSKLRAELRSASQNKPKAEEYDFLHAFIGSWLAEKIKLFAPKDRERIAVGLAAALVFPTENPIGDVIKESDGLFDTWATVCLLRLHAIAIKPYIQKPELAQELESFIESSQEILSEITTSDEDGWREADHLIKSLKSSPAITVAKNS